MTTYIVYGDTSDFYVQSVNAAWATAQSGSTLTTAGAASATIEATAGLNAGSYIIRQACFGFDTSAVPTGTTSCQFVSGSTSDGQTAYLLESSWTASNTSSFVAHASLGALTVFGSAIVGAGTLVVEGLVDPARTSLYKLLAVHANNYNNVTPVAFDRCVLNSADQSGTANDPRLVFTTSPGVFLRGVGETAAGTGAVAPSVPANYQTDDIFLLLVETANEAVSTPSGGWAADANSPQGTGTGAGTSATRLSVFWKRAAGGESAPTVADSGNHQVATILAFGGAVTSGSPIDASAGNVASSASTSVTIPAATTTTNNCLIVAITADATDSNTVQGSGWANASLSEFHVLGETRGTSGNGGGIGVAIGNLATAGSTGSTTLTLGTSSVQGRLTLALKPATGSGSQGLTPSLFTNSQSFYGPTITAGSVGLTPSLFTNTNTFYAATVSQGAQDLTPPLFTNTQSFYGPTVTVGAVTLTPSLFTNSNTFYAPTVTRGAVSLTPGLFTNGQTFHAATVSGVYALTPALFTNTATFYGPTITTGAVGLIPSLLTNTNTFYGPTITQSAVTLSPSLFTNTQTFFGPTITTGAVTLTPSLFTNSQTFYAATVTPGAVALAPSLFTNSQTFYGPTVTQGAANLTPDLFTNSQTFYAPTVTPGAVAVTPALFTNTQTFYAPTVAFFWETQSPDASTWADQSADTSIWTQQSADAATWN